MTARQKKARLRAVIAETNHPAHCPGCDEWGCGGWEEYGGNDAGLLEALWKEIKSWGQEGEDHDGK